MKFIILIQINLNCHFHMFDSYGPQSSGIRRTGQMLSTISRKGRTISAVRPFLRIVSCFPDARAHPGRSVRAARSNFFVSRQLCDVVPGQPRLEIKASDHLGGYTLDSQSNPVAFAGSPRFISGRQRHPFAVLEKRSVEPVEPLHGVFNAV